MMIKYNFIEHTADLGIKLKASNIEELFSGIAKILYEIVGKISTKEDDEKRIKIELKADDIQNLLYDWVSEIIYYLFAEKKVFEEVKFAKLSPEGLIADIRLKPIDPENTEIKTEIKAVTYHNLSIVETDDGIEACLIFDV